MGQLCCAVVVGRARTDRKAWRAASRAVTVECSYEGRKTRREDLPSSRLLTDVGADVAKLPAASTSLLSVRVSSRTAKSRSTLLAALTTDRVAGVGAGAGGRSPSGGKVGVLDADECVNELASVSLLSLRRSGWLKML